jgi:hypothetical protein
LAGTFLLKPISRSDLCANIFGFNFNFFFFTNKQMSQYDKWFNELKVVELQIETVKSRKLELQKKEKRPEGLATDEQVELEDVKETLQ